MYGILESAAIAAFDSRNRDVRESHPHFLNEEWNMDMWTKDGFPISGDHLHYYRSAPTKSGQFVINEKTDAIKYLPIELQSK